MKARLIDNVSDYPVIKEWWEGHGFPVVPFKFLPKMGVVIESQEGVGLAAGWVYMDNSAPVCWLEWVVSNPRNKPTVSLVALKELLQAARVAVESLAEGDKGYAAMLTTCRQPALSRVYERGGFEVTDKSVIHMMSLLGVREEAGV